MLDSAVTAATLEDMRKDQGTIGWGEFKLAWGKDPVRLSRPLTFMSPFMLIDDNAVTFACSRFARPLLL
jgi:hypothetical protein